MIKYLIKSFLVNFVIKDKSDGVTDIENPIEPFWKGLKKFRTRYHLLRDIYNN